MAKVLLVEDDNNLREIFEMRLQAEGYQTVTAGNGEEGLTVAMQEKPDLIIADVMMPKLSGFDMLESLRAAPEMKNTKVIMMTALGQAEDQARGEKLGVVKYLVKSQATLEDFARVIKEVMPPDGAQATTGTTTEVNNQLNSNQQERETSMNDDQTSAPTTPANDTPAPAADGSTATDSGMAAPSTNPVMGSDNGSSAPADTGQMTTATESAQVQDQMNSFANTPAPAADDSATDSGMAAPAAPSSDMPAPAPSETVAPTEAPASSDPMASSAPAADGSATDSGMAAPAAPSSDMPAPAPEEHNNQAV